MLIEATSQTIQGHVYILYGNDDLNVAAGVTIQSSTTDAVTTWDGQHKITVSGTILGFDDGINMIGTSLAQTVTIAATGRIETANDGSIIDADGVILDGAWSVLTNAGTIVAQGSGASLFVRDGATTTVTNSGTMSGIVAGVWNKFGSGTLNFTNTGTVESPNFAVLGGIGSDNVVNRGTLRGNVSLGEGADFYDGREGTVTGIIAGDNGDDRFILGTGVERIDGGFGNDTLDFSLRTAAITIHLGNAAANTGTALGDSFTSIETVIGSAYADVLTGDGMNNTLLGGGARDRLSGGVGDDVLDGGAAKDRLTGGAGADVFQFLAFADRGDVITDFDVTAEHILLKGSAFSFGTYTGAVADADFVISTTSTAQDASDRFIFRTTDQTLWFDADGTGAARAILISDLQTGVTLSASNLLII
ncbi:MAG: calcium-binding protein [Paracoccaceae bacterium]